MGVFSWNCAHCQHSILVWGTPGINDWMMQAVVLTGGEVYQGPYDGYGGLDSVSSDELGMLDGNGIMVHEACWEIAGKPALSYYTERGMTSPSAQDQGYFYGEEHDVIDPRITDLAERERLLDEGRRAREVSRFNAKAQEVGLALACSKRLAPEDRWQVRYSIWEPAGLMLDYSVRSKILEYRVEAEGLPTKEAAVVRARELYLQWLEAEEFKVLHLHYQALRETATRAYLEELKEKGRYQVAVANVSGDTIRGLRRLPSWTNTRTVYSVLDKVTFLTVATMDGPNEALGRKTFLPQEGYEGNTSPEWEARVQETHAATRESARLAAAEAGRLQEDWVSAGYPLDTLGEEDE